MLKNEFWNPEKKTQVVWEYRQSHTLFLLVDPLDLLKYNVKHSGLSPSSGVNLSDSSKPLWIQLWSQLLMNAEPLPKHCLTPGCNLKKYWGHCGTIPHLCSTNKLNQPTEILGIDIYPLQRANGTNTTGVCFPAKSRRPLARSKWCDSAIRHPACARWSVNLQNLMQVYCIFHNG